MKGLVSSDELATDVTGAEALLERHQVSQVSVVLDFEYTFKKFIKFFDFE